MKGSLKYHAGGVDGETSNGYYSLNPYTVYANAYYVAKHYTDDVIASKHYYMGAQRVSTSMINYPFVLSEYDLNDYGGGPEPEEPEQGSVVDLLNALDCMGLVEDEDYVVEILLQAPSVESRLSESEYLVMAEDCAFSSDPDCYCKIDPYWAEYYEEASCEGLELRYWYHPDYLGSVEYVTDENGEAYQYFFRSPWGKQVVDQKASGVFSSAYKFNGKEQDDETGNYYYGARYYTAELGIWLSVDPKAKSLPQYSPYVFCNNNPIVLIDPDGQYPISIITRSYAPYKTFGPSRLWYGDNRGHSLDRNASYRSSVTISHDTETRKTTAKGGVSRSHTVDGRKDAMSRTLVENKSEGKSINVHSIGKNEAQWGAQPIDQFTKLEANIVGDVNSDHTLNISGTISGDDFPNQESMVYDSEGNGLWLGNFESPGHRRFGPSVNLIGENENDVHIKVNVNIKVDSKGVFQGVIQDGKTISIDEWNKQFE